MDEHATAYRSRFPRGQKSPEASAMAQERENAKPPGKHADITIRRPAGATDDQVIALQETYTAEREKRDI